MKDLEKELEKSVQSTISTLSLIARASPWQILVNEMKAKVAFFLDGSLPLPGYLL